MTPYVIESGHITHEELALFHKMREALEKLPDDIVGERLSCHLVCHGLARAFGVEVADGEFGKGNQHSWLILRRNVFEEYGNRDMVLADMYPAGGATPFLVYIHPLLSWYDFYRQNRSYVAKVLDAPGFEEKVVTIANEIKKLTG